MGRGTPVGSDLDEEHLSYAVAEAKIDRNNFVHISICILLYRQQSFAGIKHLNGHVGCIIEIIAYRISS